MNCLNIFWTLWIFLEFMIEKKIYKFQFKIKIKNKEVILEVILK